MAITKSDDRQWPKVARVDVDYTMLTTGVAVEAVDLPANAMVIGGGFVVETAWNSATSDVLDIGDGVDADEYSATPIDLTAAIHYALDITGYQYTGRDTIDLTWTGVGAVPTAGAGFLYVTYIIEDNAQENM